MTAARELRAGRTEALEGWAKPVAGWHSHYFRWDGWSACHQVLIAPEVELAPDDGRTLVGDCALCHDKLDQLLGRRRSTNTATRDGAGGAAGARGEKGRVA